MFQFIKYKRCREEDDGSFNDDPALTIDSIQKQLNGK